MSSLRWREALIFSALGAFCGYVFAQLDKGMDHSAALARCKLQEQKPERIELCMRAAGYEFSDTDCKGAEIVFEQQRLANAAEIIKARRDVLEPFIDQYLQKHPGQSRTMAELMVLETAKEEIEKRKPAPKYEGVVSCYKRHKSKATRPDLMNLQ
jgi:hypothetical protein